MTGLEILLMVLGAAVFVASFIVPETKGELEAVDKQLTQTKLDEMLKSEMRKVEEKVTDVTEETVSYSMEKTERALERMTNEKMQAISEYTQTVMDDIHKNHEEVMFLYDMLNDKHQNLKDTASEVSLAVKEANEVVNEADLKTQQVQQATKALDEAFKPMDFSGMERLENSVALETMNQITGSDMDDAGLMYDSDTTAENTIATDEMLSDIRPTATRTTAARSTAAAKNTTAKASTTRGVSSKTTSKTSASGSAKKNSARKANEIQQAEKASEIQMQFDIAAKDETNNNEKILQLHKKGKSNVAIAKELGLGVGEVKLVIDLFKGL